MLPVQTNLEAITINILPWAIASLVVVIIGNGLVGR
jgi:hypothetical protein